MYFDPLTSNQKPQVTGEVQIALHNISEPILPSLLPLVLFRRK